MRIALFDGILESHLMESLERALVSRGHEVMSTGKVGALSAYLKPTDPVGHVEHTIQRVLEFEPEWVFVFRPASLPPQLLAPFHRAGIKLIAWLSDDPVLAHTSYAPTMGAYDLVLHCGGEEVLSYYESLFGRPTGVNFPFWTDAQAFPRVWGTETPESDALFLGNVTNAVRRRRYHQLVRLPLSVRIHGNIGADFHGVGAGYLDSDSEVVAAGARARIALNIPQFFTHYRGMAEWFPGLDELGFFEYPSRVVQYMAMGLPVVSLIPGRPEFPTFPEMTVMGFDEAATELPTLLHDTDLAALSQATHRRFVRHFSATARVMALESLLADDAWKSLSPGERAIWFARFDAEDAAPASAVPPVSPARVEVNGFPRSEGPVAVVHGRDASVSSRAAVVRRVLEADGREVLSLNQGEPIPEGVQGAVVCVSPGDSAGRSLPTGERPYWVLAFWDGGATVDPELVVLLSRADLVAVSHAPLHRQLEIHGHTNAVWAPAFVDRQFRDELARIEDVEEIGVVGDAASPLAQWMPCLATDLSGHGQDSYQRLRGLDLPELAVACRRRLTVFGPSSRATGVYPHIAAFVAAGADLTVVGRSPDPQAGLPYSSFSLQAALEREIATKLWRLGDSARVRESVEAARGEYLPLLVAEDRLPSLVRAASTGDRGAHSGGTSLRYGHDRLCAAEGMTSGVVALEMGGAEPVMFRIEWGTPLVRPEHHLLQIRQGPDIVFCGAPWEGCCLVLRPGTAPNERPVTAQLLHLGPDSELRADGVADVRLVRAELDELAAAGPPQESMQVLVVDAS